VRVRIKSRSTSARPPSTAIIKRPVDVWEAAIAVDGLRPLNVSGRLKLVA
jgi:hypothetical protein